ncbi:MAG: lysophospholipid acyltransferase family protein [Nitrospirae bacterium]|nr:lysophospholipid acyltransferase family protein [Nitrospirota bacterium]
MAQQINFSKKRGNQLGFWFFRTALKLFGLSGAYGLLYFVCLYYLLFDRLAVSAGMAYIKRRFKTYNFLQRIFGVYGLFINQGKNLIDRYYIHSGLGQFDIELQGYDKIRSLLADSQKGVILLTAHVGNWQVTMTVLKQFGKTVYLLMSPEENAAVKNALNIDSDREMLRIISNENFLGGVVEVMKVISEGSLVSIMGDRSDGYPSTEAYFLGEKAYFPYGAFSIAAAAQCPVVVLLSAKTSAKKYVVDVSHVIFPRYNSRADKKDALNKCVREFAGIMEDYAIKYPFQWFVFRDIWKRQN